MTSRTCLVIPHYRHVRQLKRFLPKLAAANLPALVVDDGSGSQELAALKELLTQHAWVTLIERSTNGGKGAATVSGLQAAQRLGHSHIVLVDADGQHDPNDVVRIAAEIVRYPKAIFSGAPRFGEDIPKARLYGREITNVLARIESGNFGLRDAMCGLRVYPVELTLPLAQACGHRTRMEMDTELLVRACWSGIDVRFLETRVVYPEEGASHFRMGWDNLRMIGMHVTLLLSAVIKVPAMKWGSPAQATSKPKL